MIDSRCLARALAALSLTLASVAFAQASAPTAAAAASAASVGKAARIDATDVRCRPPYPPAALRSRTQGTTRLRFSVNENGLVTAAEVVGSSGPTFDHQLLDYAALATLIRCPFTVGLDEAGNPAATSLIVSYMWKLE